jgi:hypothetical protein
MHGHDVTASATENYLAFAGEARTRSPAYEALAMAVADDPVVLGFLAGLPAEKRQPNLLFAAARYLVGDTPGIAGLRCLVHQDGAKLAATMLARRTQTNEPARCATLLPALALLPSPLALIEVGASAGLTLLPDRYSYDFGGHRVDGTFSAGNIPYGDDPRAPVLRCEPRGPVPLPDRVPEIIWRAGLDLNPLDVRSDDDVRWLECLVWPGEGDRAQRLADAVATARRDPPHVHRGDLRTDLPALAAQAPADATLVVYHSAVLAYVGPADRQRFAATMAGLGAVWLSNEGPRVLPSLDVPATDAVAFLLVRDGRQPLAWTDSHGAWVRWLA